MMKEKLRFICRECRDYFELFVIPGVAVFLPWWLTIRFFHCVSYISFFYRESTEYRLSGARYLNLVQENELALTRSLKVTQMVDLADMFLLLTRGQSFVQKYIDDDFSQQLVAQQLIVTPHYGAGIWGYRLLRLQGISVAMLINHPQGRYRAQDLSARFRLWGLRREGVLVFDPKDVLAVRTAIKEKRSILVMPDMPKIDGVGSYQLKTKLGRLNVTSRFFELAEKRHLPVVQTIFSVDLKTGKRYFKSKRLQGLPAKTYAQSFADMLVAAIGETAALWHMLVVAPQVMLPPQEDL